MAARVVHHLLPHNSGHNSEDPPHKIRALTPLNNAHADRATVRNPRFYSPLLFRAVRAPRGTLRPGPAIGSPTTKTTAEPPAAPPRTAGWDPANLGQKTTWAATQKLR